MSSPVVSPQSAEEAKSVDSPESADSSRSGRLPRGVIAAIGCRYPLLRPSSRYVSAHTKSKARTRLGRAIVVGTGRGHANHSPQGHDRRS